MPRKTSGIMGRPPVDINWEEFDRLLEMQCSCEELAHWFRCSPDTIAERVKKQYGVTFPEYAPQRRIRGKVAIRRKLFQIALAGNTAALIFLSKNLLGYSDKVEAKINDPERQKKIDELATELSGLKAMDDVR